MICTVMGYGCRPYDFEDEKTGKKLKGTAYKISVSCGSYPVDQDKGVTGSGEIYETYKCDKLLIDSVEVGFVVNLDIDDSSMDSKGFYRVKSAMLRVDDENNLFAPIY